jgi:anaerobic dimethyl sulfoxide reductase subunit B
MAQMGLYFDQTRCTGCYTCVVACKDWYDLDPGPVNYMRVQSIEKGTFPDLFAAYLALPCTHCLQPPCVQVCPIRAITKREEDGIVVVDSDQCLGKMECPQKCLKACPWKAPQFGPSADAKMQKCELCFERREEGQQPICVEACPMFALEVGPLEELQRKYGQVTKAEGFKYLKRFGPAVVFKPKRNLSF